MLCERFTADEAFERGNTSDPINLGWVAAQRIMVDHGARLTDMADDREYANDYQKLLANGGTIRADRVLSFLGY